MKNKGFTLIELLVVVAIIGILAAVGVVAYSGYTSSAKKATSIANWKSVSKYISNQVMKCSIGDDKAMDLPFARDICARITRLACHRPTPSAEAFNPYLDEHPWVIPMMNVSDDWP